MISFTLVCSNAHEFEAWFSSGSDFDAQKERGLVECRLIDIRLARHLQRGGL